jgi:hypothetical protein
MPGEGTQVLNKLKTFVPLTPKGRMVIPETTGSNSNPLAGGFQGVTGSTLLGTNIADVIYNQAAAVAIEPAQGCPSNTLPYLQRLELSVNGNTAWASASAGVPGIGIEDTLGNPFAFFPLLALTPSSSKRFPTNQTILSQNSAVVSYVAATGVITFAANTFTTTTLAGVPAKVVAGTGIGQTFFIASNTGTTLTPALGTFPVALDNTSVVAIYYYAASAATATTISCTKLAAWPTVVPLNNGFYVVIVAGTGIGQVRPVVSNTATAITVATWDTTPDTTSIFCVTDSPSLWGSVDLGIASQSAIAGLNQGVQAAVIGTMSAGSPVRLSYEGYWAYNT